MRVWILRRGTGDVDGLDLGTLEPGEIYQVSQAVGAYLLEHRLALVELRARQDLGWLGVRDRRKKPFQYPREKKRPTPIA